MTTNTLSNKPLSIANIFGIKVNSGTYGQVLNTIVEATHQRCKPLVVFTPNPAFILQALKKEQFMTVLNTADINLPDGFGFMLFNSLMSWGLTERIAGSDIVRELLEIGNKEDWRIGLVGLRGGVASEITVQITRLSEKYANITFVDLEEKNTPHMKLFQLILACHGMVKQEEWIVQNKDNYSGRVMMGVGGSLDFLTGFTKRAPVFVQKVGLEWLWRVSQKPSHYKRALTSIVGFTWLVIKEKLEIRN